MAEIVALDRAEEQATGGKAKGLARLIRLGLAVPPGIVIVGARQDENLSALLSPISTPKQRTPSVRRHRRKTVHFTPSLASSTPSSDVED